MSNGSVITITMNPAIDKSTMVEQIIPEAKLRCEAAKYEAGGGGINVSKGLKRLGVDSMAFFTAGGHNGNMLKELVNREGIGLHAIASGSETRENFIVRESSTNNQYRFNIRANSVEATVVQQCLEGLAALTYKPEYVVASGSLPEGVPDHFYADVAKWSGTVGAKFVLDTSGPSLQLAVGEKIFLLKPNLSELSQLAGREIKSTSEAAAAAQVIIRDRDCQVILVSLGAAGALLVTKDIQDFVAAPVVKKQSTVGAGDSMVAGMIYGLLQNYSLKECIRYGVACGTAATMNPGTELFHEEDAKDIYEQLNRAKPLTEL